jgi:hypothetical protein
MQHHDEGKLSHTTIDSFDLDCGETWEDVKETKQYLMIVLASSTLMVVGIGEADFTGGEFLNAFGQQIDRR